MIENRGEKRLNKNRLGFYPYLNPDEKSYYNIREIFEPRTWSGVVCAFGEIHGAT